MKNKNNPGGPRAPRYPRNSEAAIGTVCEFTPEIGTSVCAEAEGIRKRAAQERARNKAARLDRASPSTDFGERVESLNPTDPRPSRVGNKGDRCQLLRPTAPPRFRRGIHLRCAAYYQSEKDLPQTSSRVTKIRLGSGNTPIAASRHRRFGVEGRPTTGGWTGLQSWRRG